MSGVCNKCFNLIDAFMQMCPQGGLCESAPPQPVAAQEKHGMLMCKRRGCNVGGTRTLINGYCYQHQPSPAATTQPKPAPQADKPKQIATFERIAETYNDSPIDSTVHHLCIEVMKWREWSAAQAPLLEKIAELESALRREERDSDQLMNERDEAVDVAERLSDAISKYFKTDIGEHSNLNDPFENAVEVIESRLAELESAQPNLGVERLRSRMLGLVDGFRAAQPKAEPVEKLVSDEELVRLVYEFNLQDSRQLIYESEKDGIDIEVPTHNYRLLADYLLYRQREERSGE